MRPIITLPLMALIAGPAAAAPSNRVTTRSGQPEILLLDRDIYAARVQLAYVCEKLGWNPLDRRSAGKRELTCDVPTREKVSIYDGPAGVTGGGIDKMGGSMLDLNAWLNVKVSKTVTFKFTQAPRGVIVRASAQRLMPSVAQRHAYTRVPIESQEVFLGLMNVIALAGDATFAPGTTFAKFGYVGFRSDRFAQVDVDGRERTAIQVGVVEAGSPAEQAGLKTGDFILKMNGRTFGGYDGVADFLRSLKPGENLAMLVERGRDRMELQAVAADPPAILAQ